MKKEALLKAKPSHPSIPLIFLILLILIIPLTSAELSCSDNSEITTDQDEIDLGSSTSINQFRIGLAKSRVIVALQKISTDLITEGNHLHLTTESNSTIELSEGTYTISVTNSSDDKATIGVDNSQKEIEEGDTEELAGLEVFLYRSTATSADVIIGTGKLSLSNTDNPNNLTTVDNKTYFIELFTASASNAIIIVKKCETGVIQDLSEESEEESNETDANQNQEDQEDSEETPAEESCADLFEDLQDTCCQSELDNDQAIFNIITEQCEPPGKIETLNETNDEANQPPTEEKKGGLISRIINWLKKLLGFD